MTSSLGVLGGQGHLPSRVQAAGDAENCALCILTASRRSPPSPPRYRVPPPASGPRPCRSPTHLLRRRCARLGLRLRARYKHRAALARLPAAGPPPGGSTWPFHVALPAAAAAQARAESGASDSHGNGHRPALPRPVPQRLHLALFHVGLREDEWGPQCVSLRLRWRSTGLWILCDKPLRQSMCV